MADPDLPDREGWRAAAAQYVQRIEFRAKSAAKAAALCTLGGAFLIGLTIGLDSCAGWSVLGMTTVVVFGVLTKRSVRESVADFQHTFRRAGADPGLRESVLEYLWKRAHPSREGVDASKAAKDVLNALGIKFRPQPATEHVHSVPASPAELERPAPEIVLPPVPPVVAPTPPATPVKAPTPPRPHVPPAPVRPPPQAPRPTAPERTPRAPPAPAVLPPAAPAPPPAAARPPGTPHPIAGAPAETQVTCPSCGTTRTVARGDAAGLCPVCFPQIRLEV
jgi:hypothetical protein